MSDLKWRIHSFAVSKWLRNETRPQIETFQSTAYWLFQANRAIIIRDGDGGGDGDTCGDNYGDDNTLSDDNDGDGDTYGDGDINAYMRTVIWSTSHDGNICHLAI